MALAVSRRVRAPAVLRQHVGCDARLPLLQRGVDQGAEELVGLGALVGRQQRIALGLVDQHAQAAVAGQPGQHADAAEQVRHLPAVVTHGVDAGELKPARHGLVHGRGAPAAHQPLAPGLALAGRRRALDCVQSHVQRVVLQRCGCPQVLAPARRRQRLLHQRLDAAFVAIRVAQAAQQAAVDGNGAVSRHFGQVQAGHGHQKIALQRLLRGQLHQVGLAEAVFADHRPHRAAVLVRRRQPVDQAGPLRLQANGQFLDVLRRGHADPQRLQQLARLVLAGRHGLAVQAGQRRGRRQRHIAFTRKLMARPAKAQPALEAHQPLAAVAIDGRNHSTAVLRMFNCVANAS